MESESVIYWNKLTGRNNIDIPFMSKEKMKELYVTLQDHRISRDQAIITIGLSELSEVEKLIVSVNLGQFKERTKVRRWVYLKLNYVVRKLKNLKQNEKA